MAKAAPQIDFRNSVMVMTSNVGSSALFDLAGSDPERARKEAMEALRKAFRPEFINRIDDIVLFNPLGQEQLNKIIDLELAKVMRLLAERKVRIELTPAARERVVQDGYDPAYGARPASDAPFSASFRILWPCAFWTAAFCRAIWCASISIRIRTPCVSSAWSRKLRKTPARKAMPLNPLSVPRNRDGDGKNLFRRDRWKLPLWDSYSWLPHTTAS